MRTATEARKLLPRGLRIESPRIEPGRVSISVSSGKTRCRSPLCGRGSSWAHSRPCDVEKYQDRWILLRRYPCPDYVE